MKLINGLKLNIFQHWDRELAYLAELLARTCTFHHYQCHKTGKRILSFILFTFIEFLIFSNCADQYPWAGQNIAYRGNTGGYEDPNLSIQHMVDSWFLEYKSANMNYIHAYPVHGPRYSEVFLIFTTIRAYACLYSFSLFAIPSL